MFPVSKTQSHLPQNLVPRIVPLSMFESYVYNAFAMMNMLDQVKSKEYCKGSDPFFIPYEADLGIGFCKEEKNTIHIVKSCDIEEWGIAIKNVINIARDNLEKRGELFTLVSSDLEIWHSTLHNNCDSGVMLCKDRIKNLNLSSYPILFFLGKNDVLITSDNNSRGLDFCIDTVSAYAREQQEFLTTNTYKLMNDEWLKVKIIGDGKIYQDYELLTYEELKSDSIEFMEYLETLFGQEELSISRYDFVNFTKDSNKLASFALWKEHPRCWIPRVDRVVLIPSVNRKLSDKQLNSYIQENFFDWDLIEKKWGHKMKKLDFYHEIWEFTEFPTSQELTEWRAEDK